ncbi:MAG: cation diffusion facilitator family transporter [Burkholderiaceae bacterium]|jgi:cation diffusion facilitator family transporter|nr:cation diffusion facilitator family transporter [Burkholderiaceae bacterium]
MISSNPARLSAQIWLTPRRLMALSIAVALLTIGLKTTAWFITGSVGLLSDAMESFVNLAAAMFGLTMLTVAARPADDEHPFGHAKAEYFSSGFEGILIIGAAVAIIWAALPRLWNPQPLENMGWGLALAVGASALNGLLAWVMFGAARRHRSIATEADAQHLLADVWASAGVVTGLTLAAVTGWLWLDALVAIGVALHILHEGWRLLWRSSQGLMDTAVDPDTRTRIDAVLAQMLAERLCVGEIVAFDHVQTRAAGQRLFVNLHMHLPGSWTLARSAQLRAQLEQALLQAVPGLQVGILVLPTGEEPLQ